MDKQGYCEFCMSNDDVSGQIEEHSGKSLTNYEIDFLGGELEIYNYIMGGELVLDSVCNGLGEELDKIKINFCPMCGRPLKTDRPRK